MAIHAETDVALALALRYIEALPPGYNPGQRRGPNERELHAALVVAIRKRKESEHE